MASVDPRFKNVSVSRLDCFFGFRYGSMQFHFQPFKNNVRGQHDSSSASSGVPLHASYKYSKLRNDYDSNDRQFVNDTYEKQQVRSTISFIPGRFPKGSTRGTGSDWLCVLSRSVFFAIALRSRVLDLFTD